MDTNLRGCGLYLHNYICNEQFTQSIFNLVNEFRIWLLKKLQ